MWLSQTGRIKKECLRRNNQESYKSFLYEFLILPRLAASAVWATTTVTVFYNNTMFIFYVFLNK